jgi:hypothetical protein
VDSDENGWAEYKKLLLDWHAQEVVRAERLEAKVDMLTTKVAELEVHAKLGRWVGATVIPAVVALFTSLIWGKFGRP